MDPSIDQTFFANSKKSHMLRQLNAHTKGITSNTVSRLKPYTNRDFKVYRKDIYALTTDLLNKKQHDSTLNHSFDAFIGDAIEYLKFKEKETQIQAEYNDLDIHAKSKHAFNTQPETLLGKIEESNMLMYKDYNIKPISLDQFVKKKTIHKISPVDLPVQRIIKHKTVPKAKTKTKANAKTKIQTQANVNITDTSMNITNASATNVMSGKPTQITKVAKPTKQEKPTKPTKMKTMKIEV